MNFETLKQLAIESVTTPRDVAERMIRWPIDRSTLWMGLILVIVLNTLSFQLTLALFPAPMQLPPIMTTPFAYALAVGGGFVIMVLILTWLGKAFGGHGELDQVLMITVWLQLLRFAAQVVLLGLAVLVEPLANLLTLVVAILGVWIFLNFLDVVHGFQSIAKTFLLVAVASIGVAFGLAIILLMTGLVSQGIPNV